MNGSNAIEVREVVKRFGKVGALDGVDLTAGEGEVLGLLGPNGAGKTTLVRILTTLLRPDSGSARVLGLDVVRDAGALRERIGLAGQYAAVDENLTGLENLTMVGRLYGAGRSSAKARGQELLEQFDLLDAARRPAKTYSGGMRRRLDLSAAPVAAPPLVFLDEAPTGLDPRARLALWDVIDTLVAGGTTALLTTQYLDEAERLASKIAVIDHGRLIAEGTADQLKDRVGGERLEVQLEPGADTQIAINALAPMADEPPSAEANIVRLGVRERNGSVVEAVRRLGDAGVGVQDIAFGGFVTALGLNEDVHKGLIDRFRSLPMARPAVLAGRTFSDIVTNALSMGVLLLTGLIIGFSFHTSISQAVAGIGLLLLFGYAFSWFFALVGLLVSTPESANSVGFIAVFPLTFISSAFVPPASMPSALRAFANVNPFTVMVDAMRSLWLGTPAHNYVWGAAVWSLVIIAVFAPLAVARYRRTAGG